MSNDPDVCGAPMTRMEMSQRLSVDERLVWRRYVQEGMSPWDAYNRIRHARVDADIPYLDPWPHWRSSRYPVAGDWRALNAWKFPELDAAHHGSGCCRGSGWLYDPDLGGTLIWDPDGVGVVGLAAR